MQIDLDKLMYVIRYVSGLKYSRNSSKTKEKMGHYMPKKNLCSEEMGFVPRENNTELRAKLYLS